MHLLLNLFCKRKDGESCGLSHSINRTNAEKLVLGIWENLPFQYRLWKCAALSLLCVNEELWRCLVPCYYQLLTGSLLLLQTQILLVNQKLLK